MLILSEDMKRQVDVRVKGVHGDLILCSITNNTFIVRERDVGGSCAISLIVCNNFYTIILPHTAFVVLVVVVGVWRPWWAFVAVVVIVLVVAKVVVACAMVVVTRQVAVTRHVNI